MEVRSRAALVKWMPEQLVALEEESVRANGRIPCEERYSVLSQKLGWRVKYQNIKVRYESFVLNEQIRGWDDLNPSV